jgi:hypothetical protein
LEIEEKRKTLGIASGEVNKEGGSPSVRIYAEQGAAPITVHLNTQDAGAYLVIFRFILLDVLLLLWRYAAKALDVVVSGTFLGVCYLIGANADNVLGGLPMWAVIPIKYRYEIGSGIICLFLGVPLMKDVNRMLGVKMFGPLWNFWRRGERKHSVGGDTPN